ncbi:uncharacterized protein LOC116164009 [Photinus pyralis]|uniref:uncharacterized protein LOC116164009 n=1 Tax=Photinus pyralis TaxID=7054 RepID=UPI0012672B7E|nr:uncharacterized protein LOC116164009 [Photinus pyralis]
MFDAIKSLLKSKAIVRCESHPGQCVSNIFLADKPDGGKRFILNLKYLNTFLESPHFKMEDIRTALRLIKKDCWFTSIDIKDAYFHIRIHPNSRKFVRFEFDRQLYEFTCLPFGLSPAPYVFTKLMRPVTQWLRSHNILCVCYLDDILLLNSSYDGCLRNTKVAVDFLQSLGFSINLQKSRLIPNKTIKFLGFMLDSEQLTIFLPIEKKEKIKKWTSKFLSLKRCKIRDWAGFIGYLVSVCPGVKYGWLRTKIFERHKHLALQRDLIWWLTSIDAAFNDIRKDQFVLEVFSDASLTGWGACCGESRIRFASSCSNSNILLRCDNTTALSYINKMGSIHHSALFDLTKRIWEWCEERNLWLHVSYISSSDNWIADRESRSLTPETEWSLSNRAFKVVTKRFGLPEIDLFASKNNHKCPIYVSWQRDPDAVKVDSFTIQWSNLAFYAFPPFALILRVLQKIIDDKAEGIQATPPFGEQPFSTGGQVIREAFTRKELPKNVVETILHSLSEATIQQYGGTFKLWWPYCAKKGISPFDGTPAHVMEFLQYLYDTGNQSYGTFNSHRSALSLILSTDLAGHPVVSRFLKGISKLRPQKPRYDVVWDPHIVLSFLEKRSTPTLQALSEKLVTLLALSTAHRMQTFSLIRLPNIIESRTGFQILIEDKIKTSGPGRKQPCLQLPYFTETPNLCVATTLKEYLAATKQLRTSNTDFLFITYKKPHRIASWCEYQNLQSTLYPPCCNIESLPIRSASGDYSSNGRMDGEVQNFL